MRRSKQSPKETRRRRRWVRVQFFIWAFFVFLFWELRLCRMMTAWAPEVRLSRDRVMTNDQSQDFSLRHRHFIPEHSVDQNAKREVLVLVVSSRPRSSQLGLGLRPKQLSWPYTLLFFCSHPLYALDPRSGLRLLGPDEFLFHTKKLLLIRLGFSHKAYFVSFIHCTNLHPLP